jgi:non-ribosomal peptide synthetase component F
MCASKAGSEEMMANGERGFSIDDNFFVLYVDDQLLYAASQQNIGIDHRADEARPVSGLAAHLTAVLRAYALAWNASAHGAPLAPLQRRFEIIARTNPGATAVSFKGRALTYGELDEQADELALYLQRDGLLPGSFCMLRLEPSLAQVRVMLAVLKAGAACLQCDPALPRQRMAAVLAMFRPAVLFVRDGAESDSGAPRTIRCHEEAALLPYGWPDEVPVDAATPAHVFVSLSERGCLCISVRTHQALGAQLEKGGSGRSPTATDPASFWRPLSAGASLTIVSRP